MYIKILTFAALTVMLNSSCSSKLTCSRFYTYSSKKVNIKGISTKLKKQGVDIGELSVGEISIDPQYVVASEKLQEMDLLQYSLCAQIKGLKRSDPLRNETISKYVTALTNMIQIAQKPDSLLSSKVSKLEKAEERRNEEQRRNEVIRSTPPQVEADLIINPDKSLYIRYTFLNEIPIKFDTYITQYNSKHLLGGAMMEMGEIYPQQSKRIFTQDSHYDLNKWAELRDTSSKVTLHFYYESIYYVQTNNPSLKFRLEKVYRLDSTKLQAHLVEKRIQKYN